jgi:hypothetical protein
MKKKILIVMLLLFLVNVPLIALANLDIDKEGSGNPDGGENNKTVTILTSNAANPYVAIPGANKGYNNNIITVRTSNAIDANKVYVPLTKEEQSELSAAQQEVYNAMADGAVLPPNSYEGSKISEWKRDAIANYRKVENKIAEQLIDRAGAYEKIDDEKERLDPEDWIIYMDGAVSCGQLQDLWDLAKSYFETIKAVVIAGLVGLSLLDFTAAVFASDPNEKQKKAFKNLTIRVVIFVILIVLPELINIVITQLMPGAETCITSFI